MSETIEKPTDIEINNAHRYREKMDPTSESGSVIDIFWRAWKSAEISTKMAGGCWTLPKPASGDDIEHVDIDPRDLEALRYQASGQKAEIEAKVDFIQEIRQAMSAPPTASLLHFIQGFMAEVHKSRADRDFTNDLANKLEAAEAKIHMEKLFAPVLTKVRKALGVKEGDDVVVAAQDLLENLNTIRLVLGAKVGDSLTQAVQDLVNHEKSLLALLKRKFPKEWKEVLADSGKTVSPAEDELEKIAHVLRANKDEDAMNAAARVMTELNGLERQKSDLIDINFETIEKLAAMEKEAKAAKDPELVEKLRGYCRKMIEVANCPVCHGSVGHNPGCEFSASVLE